MEGTTRQTTNAAGFISAESHASVHIGDIHNYLDSSRHHAVVDKTKLRAQFLKRLYTSPYEDCKNRNPERASGTCEWFAAHKFLQDWRHKRSALLLVSADPGCGKSVLARYLVDEVFPSNANRTTCYFFFKDDFDKQRRLESALCCILYQLFTQKPALLSDKTLEKFREEGDQAFRNFSWLWDTLVRATSIYSDGETICILDALDECVGLTSLTNALKKYYSKGARTSTLKFLITSRPYRRIHTAFQDINEYSMIHLSGESEEEAAKITQEVSIYITHRIGKLSKRLDLSIEEKMTLLDEFTTREPRTYVWVHLVLASIEDKYFLNKEDLRTTIHNLPKTVGETYENICCKITDVTKAKKILQAVVAAQRPLHLTEIAAVLAWENGHRCHKNLERNMLQVEHIKNEIRDICGLFVIIQNSQVFLLHQTAREFLVKLPSKSSDVPSHSSKWQHSIDLGESHRWLSEICIGYLLLDDFRGTTGAKRRWKSEDRGGFILLDYAASSWPDHYRQAHKLNTPELNNLALQLCDKNTPAGLNWLEVYGEKRTQKPGLHHELHTPLLVASYFGLDGVANLSLRSDTKSLGERGDSSHRTALLWASEKGYDSIVRSLLETASSSRGISWGKRRSPYLAAINQEDKLGRTPLSYSAANGHGKIARRLLQKGAKVDARDKNGLTPLFWAAYYGHDSIVALLREKGAQVEIKDRVGQSYLFKAARKGNEVAVQMLLDRGAKVDASDKHGWTALMRASEKGNEVIVKLLLDKGAKVDTQNMQGCTALMIASLNGYWAIEELLVGAGANVTVEDCRGRRAHDYTREKMKGPLLGSRRVRRRRAIIETSDSEESSDDDDVLYEPLPIRN